MPSGLTLTTKVKVTGPYVTGPKIRLDNNSYPDMVVSQNLAWKSRSTLTAKVKGQGDQDKNCICEHFVCMYVTGPKFNT